MFITAFLFNLIYFYSLFSLASDATGNSIIKECHHLQVNQYTQLHLNLILAVTEGHEQCCLRLLELGANIDKIQNKNSAFMAVVDCQNINLFKIFLENKKRKNISMGSESLRYVICKSKNIEMLKIFLEETNENINVQAVHNAICAKDIDKLRLLIEHKVNIREDKNILDFAFKHNKENAAIFRYLLENKAYINKNLLNHIISEESQRENWKPNNYLDNIFALLQHNADPNVEDSSGRTSWKVLKDLTTPFWNTNRNNETFRSISEIIFRLSGKEALNNTLIDWIKKSCGKPIEYLLFLRADANLICDKEKNISLFEYTFKHGAIDNLTTLLNYGAYVRPEYCLNELKYGDFSRVFFLFQLPFFHLCPKHNLAKERSLQVVLSIKEIQKKHKFKVPKDLIQKILSLASLFFYPHEFKLHIEKNKESISKTTHIDLNKVISYYQDNFPCVCSRKSKSLFEATANNCKRCLLINFFIFEKPYTEEFNNAINSIVVLAIKESNKDMLSFIIDVFHPNLNAGSLMGFSWLYPLDHAAVANYIDIINLLFEHGAKIRIDKKPYKWALIAGNLECAKLLIRKDKNLINNTQKNPLLKPYFYGTKKFDNQQEQVLDLLLEYIDINAQDKNGNSMLHLAAMAGNKEAIDCIIKKGIAVELINNNNNKYTDLIIEEK